MDWEMFLPIAKKNDAEQWNNEKPGKTENMKIFLPVGLRGHESFSFWNMEENLPVQHVEWVMQITNVWTKCLVSYGIMYEQKEHKQIQPRSK